MLEQRCVITRLLDEMRTRTGICRRERERKLQVVVTRGLPDGLSEQAVRAAYQMRFRPALRDGRQVSYWLSSVEIEFNLR